MKIYDISMSLSDSTLIWPGDPEVKVRKVKSISKKDPIDLSELMLSTHSGTHLDAPAHFLKNGNTLDTVRLEHLVTRCYVKQVKGRMVTAVDLGNVDLKKYSAILFRTRNSERKLLYKNKFTADFTALDLSAARILAENKIKTVGIDYLSIEDSVQTKGNVHRLLLKNKINIIESLDLAKIKEGEYLLIALPLKIRKGDGAPLRVVLIKDFQL